MTKEPFDFWQDHSVKYLEMALKSDRMEPLENPDGEGRHTGDCGDTVAISLKLQGEVIGRVAFQIQGCMNTVASANAVAELVEGRPIAEAWEVTPERVIDFLETLPKGHHHCAELAVGALYRALADARSKQREPWRKMYGKSGASIG
ncbi:MAG TPA: iron-sulfur cluster assembly scaffold protein [Desulfobacterales bacterium]|nr:iron-sulfur cluster assembly scaffold protein [Desulfobacterales bacterium]